MKTNIILFFCILVVISCTENPSFENPNYTGELPVEKEGDTEKEGDQLPGEEYSEEFIIGEWDLVDFVYEGRDELEFGGETIVTTYKGIGSDIDAKLVLDASSNFDATGSYNIILTVTTNGVSLDIPAAVTDYSNSGNWELEGSVLRMSSGFGIDEAEVLELTKEKLKLQIVKEVDPDEEFVSVVTTIQTYIKTVVD